MFDECLISFLLTTFVLLEVVFGGPSNWHQEIETPASGRAKRSSTATNVSRPYWQRPGCHLVGHTRTISIPGCVKFNLSTNACRGYCVSFSIPAPEDIGPAAVPSPEDSLGDGPSVDSRLLMLLDKGGEDYVADLQQREPVDARMARKRRLSSLVTDLSKLPGSNRRQQQQQATGAARTELDTFWHLSGQTRSPLAGAKGNTDDKRDLISVGQCCNMMETEDVTVNLRCGHNETRRLVFKTAKTCECFFCKHV